MTRHPSSAALRLHAGLMIAAAIVLLNAAHAGPAASALPRVALTEELPSAPIDNAAFAPGPDALPAPPFHGVLSLDQALLQTRPELAHPVIQGRDARRFPAVSLHVFTLEGALAPVERGRILAEQGTPPVRSYWSVIAQPGKVWREAADGRWSRAAFTLMLVNDTENHAHQGIATFLYRGSRISRLRLQFVQQTAPYLLHQHFVAWTSVAARFTADNARELPALRRDWREESVRRLPARPWAELLHGPTPAAFADFGGPLLPKWRVAGALLRDGVLYYQDSPTPFGNFPYPLEMRFGVRSIMKSVAAPLALLRLAQLQGPAVLELRVGEYVKDLPPALQRVRFIDLANMSSAFGGGGSLEVHPNDGFAGYLEGDYDGWYTARTRAEKLARLSQWHPYPWQPGAVWRYRDQDYFLLGAALDAYLKSLRGPGADLWDFVIAEVLRPIGIREAPAVRTLEADGRPGLVWCNAGYYPTLDDLAKIALLYQHRGEHAGVQLLHRRLTEDLLAARGALDKAGDGSPPPAGGWNEHTQLYRMGFHFTPYVSSGGMLHFLPTMSGSGDNEVILYPNGLVSLRMAKAAELPPGETKNAGDERATPRAVDALQPF